MYKAIRGLLVAALAATSLVSVAAAPAHATDALAFDCTAPAFYQASAGNFLKFDTVSMTYSRDTRFPNINSLNAIGWNPADDHIYGFSGSTLYKLNNDGTNDGGRSVSGSPSTTGGTFLSNNLMLTVGGNTFTTIDVSAVSPAASSFSATNGNSWNAADIAYYAAGNVAYGLDGTTLDVATFNQAVTQLSVSTRSVNFADLSNSTTRPSSGDAWGAAYVDRDGNGYFFNNGTGDLYVIYAADLASAANPVTAHWRASAGTGSSPNDGASCPSAAAPAGIAPPSAGSFTVTFDANLGSGSMSNQTGSSSAALTSNSFTRAGYTFTGWNTAANGSGTAYADGATYAFAANLALYAQWSANAPVSSTVTFNNNGGSGSMSNQTGSSSAALTSNSFTRAGYTFTGWNTAANGSGTAYANGATYAFNADLTLYAQWSEVSFLITYNSQGGSTVNPANYGWNAIFQLAPAPTRSGYTFNGWFTAPTGGTQATSPYRPGNASVTLYAQWTPVSNTITFNPQNGGSNTTGSYPSGGSVNLPSAPSNPGYTFNGWFTSPTGGTPVSSPYTPGDGGATLYAQWTKNAPATHNVNFNSQGGSSVGAGSYTDGGCINLPAAPTRDGYTFKGWAVSPDGGATVANPYCPTGSGDLTLYAQWTKNADTNPTPVTRDPVTVVISGFGDGSSKLTWAIKKKIDAFLTKYNDYKFIQCVGFTEGPTVLKTDKALSKARATVSCAYALAGLGKGLTAKPAKAGNETVEKAQLRRVEITLSDN